MKKVVCFFTLFVMIADSAMSQGGGGGYGNAFKPDNKQFAKMGEIIPPAPDATAISRYGGINIELNSGSVNKAIELRAISNKTLSVPITLFFKSNGISVSQFPSRVGMGWAISAGGQISRVIHGQDDLVKQRYVPGFNVQPNDEDPNTTTYCWHLMNDGDKDSEPDIFSFSAGAYSGKFLFDNSGNIVQLPVSNVKIEYNSNPSTSPIYNFKITTPDGIQYYYGGTAATESTKYVQSSQGGDYNPNAWCLNKVLHPSGYYTTFTYEYELISPYTVGRAQTHYKLSNDAGEEVCMEEGGNIYCLDGVFPTIYDETFSMSAKVRLLKEITTSYGAKVTFDYSVQNYPEKIITEIKYYNENNLRISKYELNYSFTSGTNLPFLHTIKEYDFQGKLLNSGHKFEYYGLTGIPTRVTSFSQDHWGFYNGKNNSTLVAKPDDEELSYQFPYSTADRKPDIAYTVNGMLKKITYPTGGIDEIDYEANSIQEMQDQNPYAQYYQTIISSVADNWTESAGSVFNVTYENKIKVWYQTEYVGQGTWEGYHHDKGRIKIIDLSTNLAVYDDYINVNAAVKTAFPTLATGTYKLVVLANGVNIRTDGNVKVRTGSSPDMQSVSVAVGGLRVKKTTTSDNIVNNPIVKRYYYGTLTNLNVSSASFIPKPRYLVDFTYTVGFLYGNCAALLKYYQHKALHYNAVNRLYLNDGKIQEYTSVIESVGGDNFENGAIEHKFHVVNDISAQPIRGWYNLDAPPTNSYYMSKGEIETNVFAKKSGNLVPVSSVINDITIDSRKFTDMPFLNVHQKGPLLCQLFSGSTLVGPYPLHHQIFDIHKYYITSAWKYLSKKTEKQFDENGQNPLTVVTDYYYDDDRNLMLSRTEMLNSKGELLKQQMKYPHDFSATGNVYEDMVNKNMIDPNVETKVFKNGQELFNSKNNYSNSWYIDKHVVAIDNIEEQKAGYASEVRFRYYSYDTDGNPLELSRQDDARQSMIWDYKSNFPVAKVINASQEDIAYSSFEADGKGNWIFTGTPSDDYSAPTGKKVYVLTGSNNITRNGLNSSKTYIVSYWKKETGALGITGTISGYPVQGRSLSGWRYYEHRVTGQSTITVSGTGTIDELRLYPENALMTTYTYEPMIGMTGQCDANNKTTYYEYDGFGRLVVARDLDRNIIKKICYNYAGQVEDCNTPCNNRAPNWQNTTTALRCEQDITGQNTGYREQEQRDMNTCSPTYDQTQWVQADYNPWACPPPVYVNLTSTNIGSAPNYIASYYNTATGYTYDFSVSTSSELQPLGTVPEGNYTLNIYKTSGIPLYGTFKSGCFKQTVTGTSATFYNVAVSTITCNSITVDISGQ